MTEERPYAIRLAREADMDLIFSSWLRSYRDSPKVSDLDSAVYFTGQHRDVEAALKRCLPQGVHCAVSLTDDSHVLGWCAVEFPTLHYIYVKREFRRSGVARALLEGHAITRYSHKSRIVMPTHDRSRAGWPVPPEMKIPAGWIYNPYAMRNP